MYRTHAITIEENVKVFCDINKYKINKKITNTENIQLECSKDNNPNLTIVILLTDEGAVKKSADMEKIINNIKDDIIILTPVDVTPAVQKKIDSILAEKRKNDTIAVHNYKKFSIVIPHRQRAIHRIMSKEEVDTLLSYDLYKSKSELPRIMLYDPQSIWLCAKVGDVIHIKRPVETAVYEDAYRVVVRGDVVVDVNNI